MSGIPHKEQPRQEAWLGWDSVEAMKRTRAHTDTQDSTVFPPSSVTKGSPVFRLLPPLTLG